MKESGLLEAHFKEFEGYEVHPVEVVGTEPDGTPFYEQCEPDSPSIALWSLYGRYAPPKGGLDCFADFDTRDDAEEALALCPTPIVTLHELRANPPRMGWTCDCDQYQQTPGPDRPEWITCEACGCSFPTNTHIEPFVHTYKPY